MANRQTYSPYLDEWIGNKMVLGSLPYGEDDVLITPYMLEHLDRLPHLKEFLDDVAQLVAHEESVTPYYFRTSNE
jgi:hypothetical protein